MHLSAREIDPKTLENEIHRLNDDGKYEKSIIRLEEIIGDPHSTAFDRYNAYLQKAFTYKRVFNYTESANNLNLAATEGAKSEHKEEARVRIAVEKFFIIFDLQKNRQARAMVHDIEKLNLNLLDEETHALYTSALAVLDIQDGKYNDAEAKINECIAVFQKINPSHLPNMYSKKMLLYEKMKKPEAEILNAFNTGLQYANEFNSAYYRKSIYVNIWEYYVRTNKPEKAEIYRKLADDVKYDDSFAVNDKSLKLAAVEKQIQNNRIKHEQEKREKTQHLMILILLGTGALAFVFYIILNSDRKKRLAAEKQNNEMRAKLETAILNAGSENSQNKDENYPIHPEQQQYQFSERQLQIIELVKEGKTNKEIGAELFISENTVKYHLKNIYNELGIENRNELK